MWRTHAVGALSTLWLLHAVPGTLTSASVPPLTAAAVLGALLPDLDAGNSKVTSLSVGGIQPLRPVAIAANRAFGHRGWLHSPGCLEVLAAITGVASAALHSAAPIALLLGYASHLLLDAATPAGIPGDCHSGRRLRVLPRALRIRTGSPAEDIVFALSAAVCMALLLDVLTH